MKRGGGGGSAAEARGAAALATGRDARRGEARAPAAETGAPATEAGAPAARAWRCELAGTADDPALRRLLREAPLGGAIRLSFPREPSYFAAARLGGERPATIVVRRVGSEEILAMGSRSVQEVWFDGRPALLGYLGQLRAAPGRRLQRHALAEGYALARRLRAEDELPFDLTSIVADNRPARRLLERGLPGLPAYTPIAELVTLALPARAGRPPAGVSRPPAEEIPALADRLARWGRARRLAPRWETTSLRGLAEGRLGVWVPLVAREAGELAGCAAVWDQRPLRQCVVQGYSGRLRRLRPWLNAALRAARRPTLPPPGTPLRMAYLSHLAAPDADVAGRLVEAARRRAAELGLDYLSLAFPAGHPWLAALGRRFGGRPYVSVLYLVHDRDFDPATAGLDGGSVHVEAARL